MHDDQKTSDYPLGYTPMTDDELIDASSDGEVNDTFVDCLRLIERATLARLPKPDAEPVAWKVVNGGTNIVIMSKSTAKGYAVLGCNVTPLYAHPPKPAYVPASPEVEARVDAAVKAGRINDKRDAERDMLMDALFKCYAESGADTDCDTKWHCTTEQACARAVRAVQDLRKDYDDALKEIPDTAEREAFFARHDADADVTAERDLAWLQLDLAEARERELLAQRDELLAAGQRVTRAFKALGVSRRFSDELEARAECERAMVALDAAIAKVEGGGM